MINQDDRWEKHYNEIVQFMEANKRRPSKYCAEERHMQHWLKYNKKLATQGKLPEEREGRFNELLSLAKSMQRLNQYAYADDTKRNREAVSSQLSLF